MTDLPSDPVDTVVSRLERSRRVFAVVLAALAGVMLTGWLAIRGEGAPGTEWIWFALLAIIAPIYVAVPVMMSRRMREMTDFVQGVRPRLRHAGLHGLTPIMVFDNHVVLRWLSINPFAHIIGFWRFFDSTGAPVALSILEARGLATRVVAPWAATLVRHSAGRPFRQRGAWTEPWSSQLDRLRERLGVLPLYLDWHERSGRKVGRPEVLGVAMASANKLGKMVEPSVVLSELDLIQELLAEARRFVQARGLHRRRPAS